jgi:hypothetical protein
MQTLGFSSSRYPPNDNALPPQSYEEGGRYVDEVFQSDFIGENIDDQLSDAMRDAASSNR